MIFSVGAMRSGTFWLQRILAAHPEVAAVPSETYFFSHGIAPLLERFHHGARGSAQLGKLYVDPQVLRDAVRDFCDRLFAGYAEPGTARIAERTPAHVRHLGLIADIYPDAHIVHIIRDGRDVARSHASMDWGPRAIEPAAREWRDSILAARQALPLPRYHELRYEDLLARPEVEIARLYAAVGLPADRAALDAAIAEAGIQRNLDPVGSAPATGKWRSAFSAADLNAFESVAGELLAELGYAPASPGAAAAPREAPGKSPARRAAGLRRRITRQEASPAGGEGHQLRRCLGLCDELLEGIATRRFDRAAALLSEDAVSTVVDTGVAAPPVRATGREAAMVALRDDPALQGRQIVGDLYPAVPHAAVALSYELPGGGRADRTLVVTIIRDRIEGLTIYRHPSVGP